MRKDNKVIHQKLMPARLPIWFTATIYLLAKDIGNDYFTGGAIVFVVIIWIVIIIIKFLEKQVDIFGDEE